MDSLFPLYMGNLNVELAQCRQLIVWLRSIVKSLIQVLPFPSLMRVRYCFILICGLWSEDLVRCVHSDRALVCGYLKSFCVMCKCAALSSYLG